MSAKLCSSLIAFILVVGAAPASAKGIIDSKAPTIRLEVLGTYATGVFDESASEIPAFDSKSQRVFVTNSADNTLDILDVSNPSAPFLITAIDLSPYGAGPNSVAAHKGVIAVAVEADPATDPGRVVFFDADGVYINSVVVGALPDMLTFSPNGQYVLVANEGEPNDDYTIDPEGSVSVIDVRRGVKKLSQEDVATAGFEAFNNAQLDPAIRIFGPDATVAQDLEPEYLTVSHDSRMAWVTLQENNALAVIDVRRAKVKQILPLGTKNHGVIQNAFDASNRDDGINIVPWPVAGMYQPDAIASYRVRGKTYLVTANEGDARDYDGFSEEERVEDLILDPAAYPNADELQEEENLGRLNSTTATGDSDGDGDIDLIHAYGARSFSIWTAEGDLVYDSGSDFERITATLLPDDFNSNNDENDSFDNRSDDKGPEPEAVTVGTVFGRSFAFIGLERVGGIMVYDVSNPMDPRFVQYINNRDFSGDAAAGTAGDLGPEGVLFIPRSKSPIKAPLLVVTNEISGTTTLYAVRRD